MRSDLVAFVRTRADDRCEYCRLPQAAIPVRFVIEHVIARKHDDGGEASNLALSCQRCNLYKGPNIAGIDPVDATVTPLFHPRRDAWSDHFHIVEARIDPITAIGRVTEHVLRLNADERMDVRRALVDERRWP